jgi:hypothetical protein
MRRFMVSLALVMLATSAFAWDDRYEITPDSFNNSPFGAGIEMRKRGNYDPANKYQGTVDKWGDVRLRNWNGDTVRGNIDKDGYGTLRDQDGTTWRVRPR